jgi:hypothetical protein
LNNCAIILVEGVYKKCDTTPPSLGNPKDPLYPETYVHQGNRIKISVSL